jgi:hypothetical protein
MQSYGLGSGLGNGHPYPMFCRLIHLRCRHQSVLPSMNKKQNTHSCESLR